MSGVIEDVFGARRVEKIMRDTWGHMDAEPDVSYPGTIVFAEGEYGGNLIILSAEFGEDAGYGPWFYEGIHDWLFLQETNPGKLYQFKGTYALTKNAHVFDGEVFTIDLPTDFN